MGRAVYHMIHSVQTCQKKMNGGIAVFAGILAGMTWAVETILLGIALSMNPLCSTPQALALAPFVSTFLHDLFSALCLCIINGVRGRLPDVAAALKTKNGRFAALAAIVGGPVGMTGYTLCVANLGASIGAVASAVYPAIGAVLAFFFLKEKMPWYRWLCLFLCLLGVYGLSYSPEMSIHHFWLGVSGALMCAFGWGIEGVIIAKCVRDYAVSDNIALQIRQTTSALVHGVVILPLVRGWNFTFSLFHGTQWLIPVIAAAAVFASLSYHFYYHAIREVGTSRAMALNISYSAWAVIFSILFLKDYALLNPVTLACTAAVLLFGILAGTASRSSQV